MGSLQTIDTETVLQLFDDHIFSQKRTVAGGVGDNPLVRTDCPCTSGIHRTLPYKLRLLKLFRLELESGI